VPRFLGALSVVILVLVVVALYALKPEQAVALGLVFPILTSVFITSTSLVVAYVSVKAYSRELLPSLLFLGCGAIVLGCTSLLAAMFLGTEGQNFSATVFASGAFVSAVFHLSCASLTYLGSSPKLGRDRQASFWVLLASLLIISIVVAALEGALPQFYSVGTGTTILDHAILGVASFMFAVSAALIFLVFYSSKSEILYSYSLALGATAVGLVAISVSNGDLSGLEVRAGWVMLYLGGVLLMTSVLSAERLGGIPARVRGKEV